MISHSPPIFSHSPPVGFLADYMTHHHNHHHHHHHPNFNSSSGYNDDANGRASRYCRPQVITLASKVMVNNAQRSNAISGGTASHSPVRNGISINGNVVGGGGVSVVVGGGVGGQFRYAHGMRFGGGGIGGCGGLERMASAPLLPTQPKSCLSRKSCLHKTSAFAAATSTPSITSATAPTAATTTAAAAATTTGIDASTIINTTTTTATTAAATATSAMPQQISANEFNHTPYINGTGGCGDRSAEQSRTRKHVVFADDEGLSLTEVRVMSEPSNVPPYWSIKFLEQITQGLVSPHPADQWTVDFKQPASDYLSFRQKIEKDFVSLENVIVKDEDSIVVGTVKVKNISFEKEVIVRVTWDDWKSQQDIFCTFARAYGASTCAHVVFDTFSFKITLPPSSMRLEFCICYRVKDKEYWDNNDGHNYTITKRSPFYYNALSPYDKSSPRNTCQTHAVSSLSDALAKVHDSDNSWQNEPHPYW